ncbi:hypothetical protein [Pantoea sp. ME81]|uniref:hypothetical protein n=1 Tax=Pantoea sp. ME81 TaxID=2743935 RepID=UPI0015F61807|nr:hypothetical protein [Pantoea sp. ME81]
MSGIKRYDEGGYGLSNMEEAADGSWVDYDSHLMVVMGQEQMLNDKIADLQQKLDAVVAENAALKSAFNPEVIPQEGVKAFTETAILDHDWNDTGEWSWVENDTDVIRAVLEAIKPETPVTDAILNAVRAEGVHSFIGYLGELAKEWPQAMVAKSLEITELNAESFISIRLLRSDATKGGSDD